MKTMKRMMVLVLLKVTEICGAVFLYMALVVYGQFITNLIEVDPPILVWYHGKFAFVGMVSILFLGGLVFLSVEWMKLNWRLAKRIGDGK